MTEKLHLYVHCASRKFLVITNILKTVKDLTRKIEKVHEECFGEKVSILNLMVQDYIIPQKYKIFQVLKDSTVVEAVLRETDFTSKKNFAETQQHKRHSNEKPSTHESSHTKNDNLRTDTHANKTEGHGFKDTHPIKTEFDHRREELVQSAKTPELPQKHTESKSKKKRHNKEANAKKKQKIEEKIAVRSSSSDDDDMFESHEFKKPGSTNNIYQK